MFVRIGRKRITSKCIYIKKMKILGENANLFNVTVVKFTSGAFTQRERRGLYLVPLSRDKMYIRFRTFTCIFHRARGIHVHILASPFPLYLYVLSGTRQAGKPTCFFALYLAPVVLLLLRFRVFRVSFFSFNSYTDSAWISRGSTNSVDWFARAHSKDQVRGTADVARSNR